MDSASLLWTVLLTIPLAYVIKFLLWRLTRRLPPGPWGLPIVGYKPFLTSKPQEDYKKMQEKYGSIFGFHLGSTYAVVLNDFNDIKEAYNREEFLDRPKELFSITDDYSNLVAMNGWEWRETRRFTLTALRNLGMGKNRVEEEIKEEVNHLVERLEKEGPDAELNIQEVSYLPLLNVIMTITCGRPYDDGDRLLKMLEEFNTDVIQFSMDNQIRVYYPILRPLWWLKDAIFSKRMPSLVGIEDFLKKEILNHKKDFDENNLEDYISYYLNEIRNNTATQTSLTEANLLGNSILLLFAGTDTTRTTMSWAFLMLAEYQDAQEKMYQEIVSFLGKEKPPSWSDRDSLPYTNAFIMESSRFKTLAPADDPHCTNRDAMLRGFCIPKDSIILANIGAVHMDKKLWGDPEKFRPERFLSDDGKKATAPEHLMPFLIGKRACPGAKLANMQVFLFVSSVVQKFLVTAPKSGLNTEERHAVMIYPINPVISFKPRN